MHIYMYLYAYTVTYIVQRTIYFYFKVCVIFLGPFTIFAPSDDAFAALPKETRDKITGDTDLLKKVLMFHVTSGRAYSSGLSNDMLVDSLDTPNKIRVNIYVKNWQSWLLRGPQVTKAE